jgi:hypothetical protein
MLFSVGRHYRRREFHRRWRRGSQIVRIGERIPFIVSSWIDSGGSLTGFVIVSATVGAAVVLRRSCVGAQIGGSRRHTKGCLLTLRVRMADIVILVSRCLVLLNPVRSVKRSHSDVVIGTAKSKLKLKFQLRLDLSIKTNLAIAP